MNTRPSAGVRRPALARISGFLRRNKKTEEEIAVGAGIAVGWRLLAATLLGAGVASAAVLAPGLIDLSNNNGAAAASAVTAPGVVAVEAKATEGLHFHDRDYPIFRRAAAKAHRRFGGYLFLHPGLSGKKQADYFLAYAKPRVGDMQPVVDSETGPAAAAASATYAALHELAAHGYRPLLYASTSYLAGLVNADRRLKGFRAWQAEYGPVLHHVAGVLTVAWQFTDRARAHGFSVDGSHLLVRSIAQLTIPKPTPKRKRAPPVWYRRTSKLPPMWAWISWRDHHHPVKLRPRQIPRRVPRWWWPRYARHVGAA